LLPSSGSRHATAFAARSGAERALMPLKMLTNDFVE